MSLLHRLAASQARSAAEIDEDIRSEIDFHLEMRTRDLIDAGLDPDRARARAEHQFGNVPTIANQCRIVQLGDRVMFQRILIGLVLVLLVSLIAIGYATFRYRQAAAAETQAQVYRLGSEAGLSILAVEKAVSMLTQSSAEADDGKMPYELSEGEVDMVKRYLLDLIDNDKTPAP